MARTGGRASADAVRQRRQQIAELVIEQGAVPVDDIVAATGVSAMTIYRDIDALEEEGLVTRPQRGLIEPRLSRLNELSAALRLEQHVAEKTAIAARAAELIRPGSSVLVDDSTSALLVLRELTSVPITVITNSLIVARELERRENARLMVLGGEYQPWAGSLLGKPTLEMIENLRADVCLVSASGISDDQLFHPYENVAQVKSAMIASAERSILLIDHTKFARRALHRFASMSDFATVVVDGKTAPADVERVRNLGVEVLVAD